MCPVTPVTPVPGTRCSSADAEYVSGGVGRDTGLMFSTPALRDSPAGEVIEGLLTDLWPVWLPYLAGAVVLIGLGAWSASRGKARWIAPAPAFGVPAVTLAVLGWSAASLADAALEGDGLTAFDRPVWQWMVDHRTGPGTVAAKIVTEVGSTLAMAVIATIVVVTLWVRRQRGDAAMVAVVGIGAAALVRVTKTLVARPRPPAEFRLATENTLSFPSGHALASTAVLGVLAVLGFAALKGGRKDRARTPVRRYLPTAVFVVVIGSFWVSIGLSRLYLGVHWATDVLAGWASGLAWLILCLTVRRLYRSYRDNVDEGHPTGTGPGLTDEDDDDADTDADGEEVGADGNGSDDRGDGFDAPETPRRA